MLATFSNPANCTDGEVRLSGGSSSLEGRVEICANRAWGTVCGTSNRRFVEANVVCRQLGHSAFGKNCIIITLASVGVVKYSCLLYV